MYSRFATGSRGLVSSRHLFSGNEFCQEEKNELDSKTIDQEDLPPGAFSHCFAQCTHRPIGGQDRQFIRERFCFSAISSTNASRQRGLETKLTMDQFHKKMRKTVNKNEKDPLSACPKHWHIMWIKLSGEMTFYQKMLGPASAATLQCCLRRSRSLPDCSPTPLPPPPLPHSPSTPTS